MGPVLRNPAVAKLIAIAGFALLGFWFAHLLVSIYAGPDRKFIFGLMTGSVDVAKIGLFAAASAAAGWITTATFSRLNSVRQHTMTVLTQVRISTEMNVRIKCLFSQFRAGVNVTVGDLAGDAKYSDWYNAATYILNYYEFLAAAMRHGDLHEPLLRDCIRSQFLAYYRKLDIVIVDAMQNDPRVKAGECTEQQSRIYQEIRELRQRWTA